MPQPTPASALKDAFAQAAPAHSAAAHIPTLIWNDPSTWRSLLDSLGGFAVNLTIAALILGGTVWASNWAAKLTAKAIIGLDRRRRPDPTLRDFAASIARYTVVIIGLIAVLQQLGVRTTSIIAVLGAASLAIGLALQGALANVAAGVMILLFRPYRVGDRIVIAGKEGVVRALDLFFTELADPDNVRVVVPNAKAFGDVIINYSKPARRRIDIGFGVDYADDLDRAIAVLIETAAADPRVLGDPAPWAKVTALNESTITVSLRCWVMPAEYWDGKFDLIKAGKEALEAAGLHFPYPHQVGLTREEAMTKAVPRAKPKVAHGKA